MTFFHGVSEGAAICGWVDFFGTAFVVIIFWASLLVFKATSL